jgi:hypothetical protein
MGERFRTLDSLPLFASEEAISAAILGTGRISEWRQIVRDLEKRGFPRIDAAHKGRYVPAVRAFYDAEYRVTQGGRPVEEPHRPAELGSWKPKPRGGHRD